MPDVDAFIKFRGSLNHVLLCNHIWFLAPPITWPVIMLISWEQNTALSAISPMNRRGLSLCCLETRLVSFTGWCANPFNDNTWWLWTAVYLFCKNLRTPSPKFSLLYEEDTTIESDSKQKMMSWWNRTESGSTSTNLEIEVPQSHYVLSFKRFTHQPVKKTYSWKSVRS